MRDGKRGWTKDEGFLPRPQLRWWTSRASYNIAPLAPFLPCPTIYHDGSHGRIAHVKLSSAHDRFF
jgi:hypothetical protein